MCGRFTFTSTIQQIMDEFQLSVFPFAHRPRYNVAPTQDVVVLLDEDGRRAEMLRWGLIPSWAKDPAIGYEPKVNPPPDRPAR